MDTLVALTDSVDCALLMRANHLRITAQYAVEYDNIDIECVARLGIYVYEHTQRSGRVRRRTNVGLLELAVTRGVVEVDTFVR